MANYTVIGELGKETGTGSIITGEELNTRDITGQRPRGEKESTKDIREFLLSSERGVTGDMVAESVEKVNRMEEVDTRITKDARV